MGRTGGAEMKKSCYLIIGLFLCALLWSCKGQDSPVNQGKKLYHQAFRLEESTRLEDLSMAAEKYEAARKIFEEAESYELLCSTLYNLGGVYRRLGKEHESVECFREALALAKKTNDTKTEALVARNLKVAPPKAGSVATSSRPAPLSPSEKSSRDEALRSLDEATKVLERAQSVEDVEDSLKRYQEALWSFKKIGDDQGVGMALGYLGRVYRALGQYGKAVEQYEKALDIFRKLNDISNQGTALNNLGVAYGAWGKDTEAEECHRKSLEISRQIGKTSEEGNNLNNLGIIYRNRGQYTRALEYYEQALEIFRKVEDVRNEGQTLNNLGSVYEAWAQYAKAKEYYEKALVISTKVGDIVSVVNISNNVGNVCSAWGLYAIAVKNYKKALEINLKVMDMRSAAQTLTNLGNVCIASGQYTTAVEYYEDALKISRKIGTTDLQGSILGNLGSVYAVWGQCAKAVELHERSLELKRKTGNAAGEAATMCNLGHVFADWGQYPKALDYYERALEIQRQIGDTHGQADSLMSIGSLHARKGTSQEALAHFYKSVMIRKEIGIPDKEPMKLIGDLYLDMGDPDTAEPLLREAGYGVSLARLYLLKSDYHSAKDFYSKLLPLVEKNRHAEGLFTAYSGLGAAFEGLEEHLQASEHYSKAVQLTEELRSSLSRSEREKFFEVHVEGICRTTPYKGLARVLTKMNQPVESLKTSEYTKARVFAEGLSRRGGGTVLDVPKEIDTRDSELNEQLAALTKSLQNGYEKENKDIIAALEPQVKEARDKRAAHVDMLRKQYPLFAATKYPQPMGLDQTALKEGEWVLSYDVTDSGLIIYLTKGKSLIKGLFKSIVRKELDGLVKKFMGPLESEPANRTLESFDEKLKSFDFKTGRELSRILLDDILPDLPKGQPLIIVPDDCLGVLPFEMLVLNSGGEVSAEIKTDPVTGKPKVRARVSGADFFGDRHPISYYQSITALTLARNHAKPSGSQKKMLVMADPVFELKDKRAQVVRSTGHLSAEEQRLYKELYRKMAGTKESGGGGLYFGPLPLTGKLAEDLRRTHGGDCRLYTGLDANKRDFLEKLAPGLPEYHNVVFATHGYFGKDLPGIKEPVLVLTLVPPGTDGYLRMSEVMGLDLKADMVALTACQTGVGQRLSGEGTMGMGRAFQYAGAKSVLMSLWSVAEDSSVKLVESFFKHRKDNKSKLEALKLARKEIRDQGYDHPFFWAPFILVGETD
jgi:tetratricopeptide (TPR) repeat protein